jgi:hypothetical protein
MRRVVFALLACSCSAACLFSLGEVQTANVAPDGAAETGADAAPPDDAADAATDGPWCDLHGVGALFCKDFDEVPDPGGWTFIAVDSPAQTAVATHDSFVSPPYAFRFRANEPYTVTNSSGTYQAANDAHAAHVAFDLKIEALPPEHEPVILYVGTDGANKNSLQMMRVRSVDGTTTIASVSDETGGTPEQQWGDSPKVGVWTRVFVDLVLGASPSVRAQLGEPGSTTGGKSVVNLPLSSAWGVGHPAFTVGIGFTGRSEDVVLVDDIVFRVEE